MAAILNKWFLMSLVSLLVYDHVLYGVAAKLTSKDDNEANLEQISSGENFGNPVMLGELPWFVRAKRTSKPARSITTVAPKKCPCNCSLNSPVCGRGADGRLETFPSYCAMKCYECTHDKRYYLYSRKSCPESSTLTPKVTARRPSPTPQCNCKCPLGKTLCARDKHGNLQRFPSDCALHCYNCTHNEDYRKVRDEECNGKV
ncbi:hypothetical protein M8J76_004860 [Diaphorina citri]|nr:hypothetical protein M8J76_004860 [Diaphorina citri]